MLEINQIVAPNTQNSFSWKFRKLRKIVTGDKPKFGVTVPSNIAHQFLEVKFSITTSGQSIILTASGTGV